MKSELPTKPDALADAALRGDGPAASSPVPFEPLLEVWLDLARDRLGANPSPHVAASAIADLESWLLRDLATLVAPTLLAEFERARPTGWNLALRIGCAPQSPSSQLYLAFVARHQRTRLSELFAAYPGLERRFALRIDQWVRSSRELLTRIDSDFGDVASTFASGAGGRVHRIRTGLSDPHDGGRSVAVLELEDGTRVVYKPRDLRLHAAFNRFLAWTSAISGIDLATVDVLPRQGYGWAEFAAPRACRSAAEAASFYRRAGALLGALHVVGATDCHFENLIARGDQPILVDVETLLHADLALSSPRRRDPIDESVLRTALLPCWDLTPDGRAAYDLSGLGSDEVPACLRRRWTWRDAGTDAMRRELVTVADARRDNIPTLDGVRLSVADHVDELVDGFTVTYRRLLAARARLLAADGPLTAFAGCTSRFVFRPTKVYAAILQQALEADACADEAVARARLAQLARAFEDVGERYAPILAAEIAALSDGDVPLFTTCVDSTDLTLPSGVRLDGCLDRSGMALVRDRIEGMSEASLLLQLEAIRGSCAARAFSPRRLAPPPADEVEPLALTPAICIAEAERIASSLAERALRDGGVARWLGFAYSPATERLQLCPTLQGLYDGRCGIALFLAALDLVNGASTYADLRLATLRPFEQLLDRGSPEHRAFARSDLGLAAGFGGVLYALVRLERMAGSREASHLARLAAAVAELVSQDAIARDDELDLLGGSAGAIVGLLAAYRRWRDPRVLERAAWCGDHLVRRYADKLGNARGEPALTGFSHGASGIAHALHALARETGTASHRQIAESALDYEARCYDAAAGNWPDLRWGGTPASFQTSWCHGAPGVAIARLALLPSAGDARIERECVDALRATARAPLLAVDNLCCGNLGLSDVLLCATAARGEAHHLTEARRRAGCVVARARRDGFYRLIAAVRRPLFSPGLFQGLAGIGYQLLRIAFPQRLPSILAFELEEPARSAPRPSESKSSDRSGDPHGGVHPVGHVVKE